MKNRTVTEQLRDAIDSSGASRYAISGQTGINQSILSRFVGGGGLKSDTLDLLCSHLDLELTAKRSKRKGR